MLSDNFIAKIEGHGSLTVDWKKETVRLNIHEGERLFEGMLIGRTAEEMHWITPRICGVCPTAHNIASLNALENALGIKPSKTTVLLRDLMQCGQMIQSHVLHLFFLVAPDYLGLDRGTELAKKNPVLFKQALSLKEVSDDIVHIVAGRNVHPTRTTIGGFHKVPTQANLNKLLKKLKETEKAAKSAVKFFSSLDYPQLKVDLELVAQEGDSIFSVSSRDIKCHSEHFADAQHRLCEESLANARNKVANELRDSSVASLPQNDITKRSSIEDYKEDIQEEIRDYSTAKFSKYKGKEFLVGSLARVALNKDFNKYELDFANPFSNIIAQAIEILYYHQKAVKIIKKLSKSKLDNKLVGPSKNPLLKGIGATEAPRGGLYHEVHLRNPSTPSAKSGGRSGNNYIIEYANIITPTAQNLTSIEKSGQALLEQTKNRSQNERERLLTMLVRAYDPCITCSVH